LPELPRQAKTARRRRPTEVEQAKRFFHSANDRNVTRQNLRDSQVEGLIKNEDQTVANDCILDKSEASQDFLL
jgi:hypothetical protein